MHPETPAEGQTLAQLFAGRPIDLPAAQAHMKKLMAAEGLPYGNRTMDVQQPPGAGDGDLGRR